MNTDHRHTDTNELNEARLTAYALGQLHDQEQAAVEAQLAALDRETADRVRRSVDEIRALAGHVAEACRQDAALEPSPALRSAVERRLHELPGVFPATSQSARLPGSRPWYGRRWARWAAAAAVLIAATSVGLVLAFVHGVPSGPRELALNPEGERGVHFSPSAPVQSTAARDEESAGHQPERFPSESAREGKDELHSWKALKAKEDKNLAGHGVINENGLRDVKAGGATAEGRREERRGGGQQVAGGKTSGSGGPQQMSSVAGLPGSQMQSGLVPQTPGGPGMRAQAAYDSPPAAMPGMPYAPAGPGMMPSGEAGSYPGYPGGPGGHGGMGGYGYGAYGAAPQGSMPMGMPGATASGYASGSPSGATAAGAELGQGRANSQLGSAYHDAASPLSLRQHSLSQDMYSGGGQPGGVDFAQADGSTRFAGTAIDSGDHDGDGVPSGTELHPAIRACIAESRAVADLQAKRQKLDDYAAKLARVDKDPAYRRLAEDVERAEQKLAEARERTRREAAARAGVPGTEQYDLIAENPFLAAASCPLSTFSIDVDTASYANVRRFLNEGRWPPPGAVRIEEMVNYFRYDYAPPEGEAPFAVHMEVAQCPWNGGHRLLRIGLKGREIEPEQRGPSNLVFLLDVSGSMSDASKLPLLKQAMKLLVDQLTEDDRVAIVTYSNSAEVRLESTCASDRKKIVDVIDSLSAGGSTHGSAGIQLAYEQAGQHFVEKGTNRVILATDGDLNVGITDDDELVKLIRKKAKSGVFLTVLGFGTGNLKDSKLEKLADHGNGIYAYVDNLREARKVLLEQISGSLVTIAKDVKIQVELNPAEVQSYRLIGYENRRLAAADFDNDKKDAGEIGAGHTVTALYEIVPAAREPAGGDVGDLGEGGPTLKYQRVPRRPSTELTAAAASGELLTLRLRYKEPDGRESKLLEFAVKDSEKRFGQASPDFQFAAAVAAFGMVLRGSQYAGDMALSAVEEYAISGLGNDPGGYRAEFVDLVRRAQGISGR